MPKTSPRYGIQLSMHQQNIEYSWQLGKQVNTRDKVPALLDLIFYGTETDNKQTENPNI